MAPLRSAAKFDPFLSLDCAPTPSTLAQSKERKGSNFAIWQPWIKDSMAAQTVFAVDDGLERLEAVTFRVMRRREELRARALRYAKNS